MSRRLAFVLPLDPDVFALHAADNGWESIEVDPESDDSFDEDRPHWRWRVNGGEVRFVDDTVIEVQYVDIAVDPPDRVEERIAEEFTGYDRDSCLEVLDLTQPEETVRRALRLLIATSVGEFDQRVFDAVLPALHDKRENVRITAMMIATYTKWLEFLPEVRRLASEDSSERVRGFASNHEAVLKLVEQLATGT